MSLWTCPTCKTIVWCDVPGVCPICGNNSCGIALFEEPSINIKSVIRQMLSFVYDNNEKKEDSLSKIEDTYTFIESIIDNAIKCEPKIQLIEIESVERTEKETKIQLAVCSETAKDYITLILEKEYKGAIISRSWNQILGMDVSASKKYNEALEKYDSMFSS